MSHNHKLQTFTIKIQATVVDGDANESDCALEVKVNAHTESDAVEYAGATIARLANDYSELIELSKRSGGAIGSTGRG